MEGEASEYQLQAGFMVGSSTRFFGPFDHDGDAAGERTVSHTMRRAVRTLWAPVTVSWLAECKDVSPVSWWMALAVGGSKPGLT